MMSYKSVVKCQ